MRGFFAPQHLSARFFLFFVVFSCFSLGYDDLFLPRRTRENSCATEWIDGQKREKESVDGEGLKLVPIGTNLCQVQTTG